MKKRWLMSLMLVAVLSIAAVVGASTRASAAPKLTNITLQLKWVPQAQFAGYYMAAAKGYYKAAGLDVTLKVGNLVRITPYVRPPIGSLALTWHALGFRELAFKAGNGRYIPTGEPSDWALAPINPR